jgi:hypothetical protein
LIGKRLYTNRRKRAWNFLKRATIDICGKRKGIPSSRPPSKKKKGWMCGFFFVFALTKNERFPVGDHSFPSSGPLWKTAMRAKLVGRVKRIEGKSREHVLRPFHTIRLSFNSLFFRHFHTQWANRAASRSFLSSNEIAAAMVG